MEGITIDTLKLHLHKLLIRYIF